MIPLFEIGIPVVNEVEQLRSCLLSIFTSQVRPRRIWIIDNGDRPLEVLSVAMSFPTTISVHSIRPNTNLGCAGSWNLIRKLVKPTSLVLMNPDTVVLPNVFERMYAHPEKLVLAYGYGCFRIEHDFWEKVGDFDEKFFPVYFEDTDHRYRVKLLNLPFVEWSLGDQGVTHGKKEDRYQGWDDDKLKWFYERLEANKQRYVRKWGGMHTEETFTVAFNGGPDL